MEKEIKRKNLSKEQRQLVIENFGKNLAGSLKVVETSEYCRQNMIIYGMNISVLRQFARLEDGLNPVKRRLLWTMYHDHKLNPDGRYVKVPEFIGHVSKYHPHGDISSTFECMSRPWENNVPLVDVSGNKGSQAGEGAANPRYLDAKLSTYAWECFFSEFDEDTTDMTDNYIRSDKEPIFLPSKYPNFLLNTSSGIGWGFSCSYPPFNLTEAFRLTQALIKNPEMTNVYLFPDSPRGYNIIDDDTIIKVCDSGIGTIKTEANIEYIEEDHLLYVDGFPEKIMFENIMVKIAELMKQKKLSGIANLADTSTISETSDDEIPSFVIELKKGVNPYQVIDELFSANVGLRNSTSLAFFFAERTRLSQYGLKGAILEWIDRRIVTKQKYYIKKLGQLQQRKHVLEGIIPILEDPKKYDRIHDIVRHSEDDEESIQKLKAEFHLTSYQCTILIDVRIKDSSKKRLQKIIAELEDIKKKSVEYREIVSSKDRIKDVIYQELEKGIEMFGKPRACKIIKEDERERPELFYRIVITKKYVKKLSVGGKQIGLISPDDDIIGYYPEVSENDALIVVDDLGKVYRIPVKKLASNDASSKGTEMISAVGLKGNAIRSILINKDMLKRQENVVIGMFTERGIVKTSPITQYITNKTEIQGILLNPGDKVCWAHVYETTNSEDSDQQLVYTKNGFGISINMDNITIQDRLTKGTQHLKLDDDDIVRGVSQVSLTDDVFVLTTKGYGKVCELASIFEASKRRQDMIRITSLHDGDDVFRIMPIPSQDTDITVHLRSGEKKEFSVKDIEKLTRLSKGKKLVPVRQGDSIYRIKLS